jgi:hypothetical protein
MAPLRRIGAKLVALSGDGNEERDELLLWAATGEGAGLGEGLGFNEALMGGVGAALTTGEEVLWDSAGTAETGSLETFGPNEDCFSASSLLGVTTFKIFSFGLEDTSLAGSSSTKQQILVSVTS